MNAATIETLHRLWRERAVLFHNAESAFDYLDTPMRLLLERWCGGCTAHDLLHAAAALGRCLGELENGDTLTVTLVDHLAETVPFGGAIPQSQATHRRSLEATKTALLSGYVRVREESARCSARAPFALPIVPVSAAAGSYAVYAGFEHTETSELVEHAERIVRKLRVLGTKTLYLSGDKNACRALRDAAELIGIRVFGE